MEASEPRNEHGNDTLPRKHQRRTSGKGGSSVGQVYCGRRIMASKYQHRAQTTIPSSSICRENSKQNSTKVYLKDSTGLVVGRGIVESQVQTGDDVVGLILFPHQVAVQVMDIYACGVYKSNQDCQLLRQCIGQIVKWSRSFMEAIDMVPKGSRSKTTTVEVFNFNDDILLEEKIISRNMQDCKDMDELEIMDPSGIEETMANAHTTCGISGVDNLPCSLPKKKYTMT